MSQMAGAIHAPMSANDNGTVDGTDIGDSGAVSAGFDLWPVGFSSDDPAAPGPTPLRLVDDAAICAAEVRSSDRHRVDVRIDNGYPQYICTISVVIENHLRARASLGPSTITADPGLEVRDITDPPLPAVLRPGARATALYSVRVLNAVDQLTTLEFSIDTDVSEKWCKRGRTCRRGPVVQPRPCGHFLDWCACAHGCFAWRCPLRYGIR
jgi:hypothetical protein